MKVEIVSISTRLLMGDILDTNTAYLSRCLREINAHLIAKVTVGNDLEMIANALQTGLSRADVVIAVGGLGDSSEDFTRIAAAQAAGLALIPQAPGIEGATRLGGSNSGGAGILIDGEQGLLVCLPGSRREMAYILETEILPYLQQRIPQAESRFGWVLLRTVGVVESSLKQRLSGLAQDARHRITYDSFAGQTNIQLWVEADSQERIDRELSAMKQIVLQKLGDHVYGEEGDKLEEVVLQSLFRSGNKLVLAECYTEHTLSRLLSTNSGSVDVVHFLPAATWTDLQAITELDGLTPEDDLSRWCRTVAERLMRQNNKDLSLLVYKNVTQGGIQLLVTLASQLGVSITQRSFGGHPDNINQWAATLGLAHLRRWLLANQ